MGRSSVLLVLHLMVFVGSYYTLRLENVNELANISITLSMILISPLLIYTFLIKPRSLHKLWIYISFLISLGLAYIIIPPSQSVFLSNILVWLLPVIEIGVIVVVAYGIIKSIISYWSINTNEYYDYLEVVELALKPKLGKGFILNAVLTELSVIYYSTFIWFKKPKNIPYGSFTYHKESQIKTVVMLFLILIIVESVFFHFLFQMWSVVAAWIVTILNIYALLYIIGLYNSVKFLPHLIKQDSLIIRLGFQSSIVVDLADIESIKPSKEYDIFEKTTEKTYYSLLKIDSPQYEIALKEPVVMKGSYGKKTLVNSVVFRADHPKDLLDSIEDAQMKMVSATKKGTVNV
ncbi:hypothetical protein [Bacillus sp. 2205SS5-2]|uniref:hypothetical protein n=1 Tax=Bacillus sp. 2205SS5-2 TaxID=3109031 RepID=UPI00300721EC